MRILVAGATGAIGRPLVVALPEAGHEVWQTFGWEPQYPDWREGFRTLYPATPAAPAPAAA